MSSRRGQEGYLQIDHRESPGIPEPNAKPHPDIPIVGRGVNFETATVRCSQCHRIVILNPDRQRPRNYCAKCDGYHCDGCTATNPYGQCETLDAVFDRLQREADMLVKGHE